MRLHYLQHVPFEGLGSIEQWATNKNAEITCTRLFNNESPPNIDAFDWLVVMGGPMNIYQYESYPWLKKEKQLIKKAIDAGKIVIGICLGAQLIADVLGAKIYANDQKEIGWFPLSIAEDLSPGFKHNFPSPLEVLHWHGDTFSLPVGSQLLASSAACKNQGFIYNEKVVALQFHLETIPESLQALVENCSDELVEGLFIQDEKTMMGDEMRFDKINSVMDDLLDYLYKV